MMIKDEHFDLLLHDDRELEKLVGGTFVERKTIHHWPLSNVQRLVLSDGRKFIYKAQAGPTVEGKFYANARSPLLVQSRILYDSDGYLCLLLEHVEAPNLKELKLSEAETLATAREVSGQIAQIEGDLPSVLDIGGAGKWGVFVGETIGMLDKLVQDGKFKATDESAVRRIELLTKSDLVLEEIAGPSAYLHGDFGGDNVLKLPDGYRVIDWTRPRWGPAELDYVDTLMNEGFNPLRHFSRGLATVAVFIRINWFAQCQLQWFKEGGYDESVSVLIRQMEGCAQGEWRP